MSPALAGGFFAAEPPGKPGSFLDERVFLAILVWYDEDTDSSFGKKIIIIHIKT